MKSDVVQALFMNIIDVTLFYILKEINEAWERLKNLSLLRQERLFGAHEIQRFNR